MKFCASAGGGDELGKAFTALSIQQQQQQQQQDTRPSSSRESATATASTCQNNTTNRPTLPRQVSATERPNDLPNILFAMRKLREGIRASRRRDAFAQRAYIFLIHASLLTRSWEAYQPALLYLLHDIHPHTPLAPPELREFVGYRVLDLACRQYELLEAFAVRRAFAAHGNRRVDATLYAVVQDDWVRFWRIKRAVDGYQRAIMEFAVERMRLHALKCLGRGYINADRSFVERTADAVWTDLVKDGVGWQLQESGNVMIRKPKAK